MIRKTARFQIVIWLLAALFLLGSAVGCTQKQDADLSALTQTLISERNELQNELSSAQAELGSAKQEIESLKAALTEAQSVEPTVVTETKEVVTEVPVKYAYGMNCTINGERTVKLSDGSAEYSCKADLIEGYVFDHWVVGEKVDEVSGPEASFTLSDTTVVQAVFHQRHIVKTVNCHLQFMNAGGNAKGSNYTEFDFEEDYVNPITNAKCTGGKISFYLTADIPKGKEVDYWLINGVKYQYPNNVTKFRVENLDENTVYEVVFKGETKKTTPTTYYNVTCTNCTFSGGGASGSSGKVPAGTTITIKGVSYSSEAYFTGTPGSVDRHFTTPTSHSGKQYVFTYTYVVNSDTTVYFRGVVN